MRTFIAALAASFVAGAHLCAATPDVGFEQRIGQALPMDVVFKDGDGVARPLKAYFGGRPVVLIFDYFRCPELCSLVASGATDSLRQLKATVGKDYSVVTVSVDPTDTPQMADSRQRSQVRRYGRTGASAGWHVLVGAQSDIDALAAAAGFHYRYDRRSQQYAHPSGVVVVTPKGIVSSYFMGIDYSAATLASAIRRAAENKTGTSVFSLLFVCFQGGTPQGRYGAIIWWALSASVALTVVAVFGGILWMLRNERRTRTGGAGAA
jgi:protein SCO1/2